MRMTTPLLIPKIRDIDQSEDYEFLRTEGLDYIEKLSSNLWTDYNVHDPGVTLVEALCYAITDLGYRTAMPMKDILAKDGMDYSKEIPPLFTARNILTNNPLTITDFRKILVDIAGVKNAWLEMADAQEVDFHAACKSSKLEYFKQDHKIKIEKLAIENGVSSIFKTIIDDPDSRENQEIKLPFSIKSFDNIQNIEITYGLEIPLPGWEIIDNDRIEYLDFINLDSITQIFLQSKTFDNEAGNWQANILVKFETDGGADTILFRDILIKGVNEDSTKFALELFLETLDDQNPIFQYHQKIKKKLALATEHTIYLKGLNEVLLEYDVDDRYGDLNSNLLNYKMVIENNGQADDLNLEIVLPSWTSIFEDIKNYEPFIETNSFNYVLINSFEDDVNNIFTTDIEIEYDDGGTLKNFIWENIVFKGISNQLELEKDLSNILLFFQGKLGRLLEITRAAEQRLHTHRNLCEDYKKISNICVNNIGVCADIILENDAKLVKTQAQILFEVQKYISPSIRFYSLKEMLEKGIPSEEIFNGPKLNHGFIIDKEIEDSSLTLKRFIYASDIINIIQDIPGVLAIKDLQLTKYDKSGNAILPSQRWCVSLDPMHKAELGITKSKILFFKEDLPYILSDDRYDEMLEEMEKLRTLYERYKLVNPDNDFPIPQGRPLHLEKYTPLRFSLPQTYGVGVNGLPGSVSLERKAKAKQLHAFLALFDQTLGNYLSQLANIGKLFSIEKQKLENEKITYYNQFLSEDDLGTALYVNGTALEDAGGTSIGANSLQRLSESHADYLDRRNRFLDHLLGRFAEDFTEYALMIFSTSDDGKQQELIDDKVSFLEEYPSISSERGKGFNYKNEDDLWDTQNVAGLKKRVSKLLGMKDYLRQNYHCPTIRDEFEVLPNGSQFTFQLKWGSQIRQSSPKDFATEDEAFYAMEKAIQLARDIANYTFVVQGAAHRYQIGIIDPNDAAFNDIFLESATFSSVSEAEIASKEIRQSINRDFARAPLLEFIMNKSGANFSFGMLHHNEVILSSPKTFTDESLAWQAKSEAIKLAFDLQNYSSKQIGLNHIFQIGILDELIPANNDILCESVVQYPTQEAAEQAAFDFQYSLKKHGVDGHFFDVLVEDLGANFSFIIYKDELPILQSRDTFVTKDETLSAKERTINYSFEANSYTVIEQNPSEWIFQVGRVVRDDATGNFLVNEVLAQSIEVFPTEEEALEAGVVLQRQTIGNPACEIEGMHLFEHILLRPKQEYVDHFFEVCLGENCFFCGEEDPYSFRASLVFPYWLRKFSEDDPKLRKRQYIDRILRQEAPAHVHLKICWIDNYQMRLLEIHYRRWLEENAKTYPDQDRLSVRLNALLGILGKLRNRYPEGFLHDCDDSEEENTILLGKSFLGSFNSPEA